MDSRDPGFEAVADPARLSAFLGSELGTRAPVAIVGRASGGSSNITLYITIDGERYVLRRPPTGDILPTSHDMGREYRFLRALFGTPVPVAEPIVDCRDPTVIGAPFYIMKFVDGRHPADRSITADLNEPGPARELSESVIDVLCSLHTIDWRSRGLTNKPLSYMRRQVDRWTRQLESTPTVERLGPAIHEVSEWMAKNVPQQVAETVVHGDYTPNNMLVSSDRPAAVVALLDWEMATIGDPLADLTWLMLGWGAASPRGEENPAGWVTAQPGALTQEEAIRRYEQKTGFTYQNASYYRAFVRWKGIAISEGLYWQSVTGHAANPAVSRFKDQIPARLRELVGYIETCS